LRDSPSAARGATNRSITASTTPDPGASDALARRVVNSTKVSRPVTVGAINPPREATAVVVWASLHAECRSPTHPELASVVRPTLTQ